MSKTNEAGYVLSESMGYLTEMTSKAFGRRLLTKIQAAQFPLTLDEWKVLNFLAHQNGLNQQQLGEMCRRDRSSMTRIIDSLEEKKWVTRLASDHDRRHNHIHILPGGLDMCNRVKSLAQETHSEAYDGLSQAEVAACKATLQKILMNLR
jgi:DNA-binding MarR family transcriptional regulator